MNWNLLRHICCIFILSVFAMTSSHAAKPERIVIALPNADYVQFAGYYIAKEKGFFLDAGLAVELQVSTAGQNTSQQVATDVAQYGVGSSELLIAKAEGAPLTALAAFFQHSPSALISVKSKAVKRLQDLEKKRVALMPNQQDIEIVAMLRKFNVHAININANIEQLDAQHLMNNQFDAFSMRLMRGTYGLVRQGLDPQVFIPRDYGIDFYSNYFFTASHRVNQQTAQVDKVLAAVVQGWEYALTDTEDTLNIISELKQRSLHPVQALDSIIAERNQYRYQLLAMRDFIKPNLIPLGYINQQRLAQIEQTLIAVDLIPEDSNFEGFIYQGKQQFIDWDTWGAWINVGLSIFLLNALWLSYLLFMNQKLKREVRERVKAEMRERHAATHDHLTGLPNRAFLMGKLANLVVLAEQGLATPGLLFMDLDRFKLVNDKYGHAAGDELLVAVTQRIVELLEANAQGQLLTRLGGDEFVVLLTDSNAKQINHLIVQIEAALYAPFFLPSGTASIGISIGSCLYRTGMTADEMLTTSDDRMYEAKNAINTAKPLVAY